MIRAFKIIFLFLAIFVDFAAQADEKERVVVLDMQGMILPGTKDYLRMGIERAEEIQAAALIVKLNTPGGMLHTSQEMIQAIFQSKIPVVFYVGPTGGSATSAGVFLTMAAHLAAMAPGTSIGAAHPVQSDGKDIEGDLRAKAESITMAMVRSIAIQRGRNTKWAEQAVKESRSLTEGEALEQKVVDFVAQDLRELLRKISGRQVVLPDKTITLPDLSDAEDVVLPMTTRQSVLNVLANPNVAALLWLGATTGIAVELYHPGLILPGVVGVICLILALAVTEVIPLTQGGILLIVVGGLLLGAELYITSGVLAVGGIISILLGLVYLIDVSKAPDIAIALHLFVPAVIAGGGFIVFLLYKIVESRKSPVRNGMQSLLRAEGRALMAIDPEGKVSIHGEIWNAVAMTSIQRGDRVLVTSIRPDGGLNVEKMP